MKCPVCGKEMARENFGANVWVCETGCKGIWFDQGELRLLDQNSEGLGTALENALRSPRVNDARREPIMCPQCGIRMHAHKFARDPEVNVDECYKCGGFFLDSGELKEIRDHYMSDAEVSAYADKIANSVPEFSAAEHDLQARQSRLEAIQRLTGFLTVNYWRKKFV